MTNRREQPTYRAVLLNTEGTATPQHFVYDVLQPYAQREIKNYLERHWNDPDVQEDIDKLVEQAAQQARDEGSTEPAGQDQSNIQAFQSEVISHIESHWESERELPPLHALQGQVWADGLQQGRLKMELFDDVEPAMEAWDAAGVPIYVLSSSGVESEKLLYEYTDVGDLTDHIEGFFTTDEAARTDPATYRRMADNAGVEAGELLFVTDRPKEAAAARKAGLLATVVDRPGRPQGPDEVEPNGEIPHVTSLRELVEKPV